MRIVETKIYEFKELDDEIQEKLIEKERESEYQSYIDFDLRYDMKEKASELITDCFDKCANIKTYYDLTYCQGSGAMIEFDIDIKDLNNKYKVFSDDEIEFLKQKDVINTIRVRHNDNFYYHEYTFNIDYDYYNDCEFEEIKEEYNITESDFNTIDDRVYKLLDSCNKHYTDSQFIKDIINMNKELTRYGYDIIENYNADVNCVIEMLSEYEYYKNGTIYKESEEI